MENSYFSIQIKCFKLVGLFRDNLKDRPRLLLLSYLVIIAPLIFGVSSVIAFFLANYQDVLASSEALAIVFTGTLAFSKFLTFCISKERFFKTIDDLTELIKFGELEILWFLWNIFIFSLQRTHQSWNSSKMLTNLIEWSSRPICLQPFSRELDIVWHLLSWILSTAYFMKVILNTNCRWKQRFLSI